MRKKIYNLGVEQLVLCLYLDLKKLLPTSVTCCSATYV